MSFPFNLSSLKNWAILLLLLVSISCAFSVFLVWARFTAPNPEIMRPQLLADYRVADKDNAFFILRGMTAAASLDAYTIGLNASQRDEKDYRADPFNYENNERTPQFQLLPKIDWDLDRCTENTNCMITTIRERHKLETTMSNNMILLQRLLEMQKLGAYEEHFMVDWGDGSKYFKSFGIAADMSSLLAQMKIIDLKVKEGINHLKTDHLFLRSLLPNTKNLLSRSVVLTAISRQAHAINALIDHNPEIIPEYGSTLIDMLSSFNDGEKDFSAIYLHYQSFNLLSLAQSDWAKYADRSSDVECYLHSLNLKIRIMKNEIPPESIAHYIKASSSIKGNHEVASCPISWDVNARQLQFKERANLRKVQLLYVPNYSVTEQ